MCVVVGVLCRHVLPLYRSEAKMSEIQLLLPCTVDIIWSESLSSSDCIAEPRYQIPAQHQGGDQVVFALILGPVQLSISIAMICSKAPMHIM